MLLGGNAGAQDSAAADKPSGAPAAVRDAAGSSGPATSPTAPGSSASPPPASPGTGTDGSQSAREGSDTMADALGAFQFGAWSGNIGIFYNREREQITSPSSAPQNFFYSHAWETITVRNDEFYYGAPGFLVGDLGVTFGLTQNRQQVAGEDTSQHGSLSGYDFKLTLFRDLPYNGSIYATRSQSYTTQAFGGNTNLVLQTAGVVLRVGEDNYLRYLYPTIFPYFSASLEAYQQRQDQNTVTSNGGFLQDQTQNVVALNARNGTEVSDLDFLLRYVDNNDYSFAQNTYRAGEARLNYNLDFGPNLNNNWTSLLNYYDRNGAISQRFGNVEERVQLFHTDDLWTSYRYFLYTQDTTGVNQTSQTATFDLQHTLWRNLTTKVEAQALRLHLPTGSIDQDYGELRFEYRRHLPWDGSLNAILGARYEYDAYNLQTSQVRVTDEPHVAPAIPGVDPGFLLKNSFVVASSVVVVDTRGGSRLLTSVDVDYTVITQGNQTRIQVSPTSVLIQPNDPLAVTYSYAVPGDAKLDSRSGWAGVGVDFGWIALRYYHNETDQTPLTPAAVRIINNVRETDWEGTLRGDWRLIQGRISATYKEYDATLIAYKERRYTAFGALRPSPDVSLTFTGLWYWTDYTLPIETAKGSLARVDLVYMTPGGLTADAYAYRSYLNDTAALPQKDTLSLAGLKLTYNWRKLTLTATGQYSVEQRGSLRTTDRQLQLSLVRRF